MFNFYSCYQRKNPHAAIAAFRSAAEQISSLRLVVKTQNGSKMPSEFAELKELLRDIPNAILIDDSFSRQQTWDLESCCDMLLSLHRAEGFGLGPAEMMLLGKPVIATGWSASPIRTQPPPRTSSTLHPRPLLGRSGRRTRRMVSRTRCTRPRSRTTNRQSCKTHNSNITITVCHWQTSC